MAAIDPIDEFFASRRPAAAPAAAPTAPVATKKAQTKAVATEDDPIAAFFASRTASAQQPAASPPPSAAVLPRPAAGSPLAVTSSRQVAAPQPVTPSSSNSTTALPTGTSDKSALDFAKRTVASAASQAASAVKFGVDYLAKKPTKALAVIAPSLAPLAQGPVAEKADRASAKAYAKATEAGLNPVAEIQKSTQAYRESVSGADPEWEKAPLKEKLTKRLPETLYYIAPDVVGSLAPYLASAGLGFAISAGSVAEDVKQKALKDGVDPLKADQLALGTGLAVGLLDRLIPSKIVPDGVKNKFVGGLLRRLAKSGIGETATEVAQEYIQIAAEATFRKDLGWDEIKTRTAMSAMGGLLGGTGMQAAISIGTRTNTANDFAGPTPAQAAAPVAPTQQETVEEAAPIAPPTVPPAGTTPRTPVEAQPVRPVSLQTPTQQKTSEKVPADKQSIIVYRGGSELETNKITDSGVSFSTSKNVADDFAKNKGGAVKQFKVDPDAKIVEYNNVPGIKYKEMDSYALADMIQRSPSMEAAIEKDYATAAKWAKENGYDVIKFPSEGEVRVLNMDKIKDSSAVPPSPRSEPTLALPQADKRPLERYALQDNPKTNEIMAQLAFAEAGKRVAVENENSSGFKFTAQKSTFPDWIPSKLRRKPVLDAVVKHLTEGTLPTRADERRLYRIVSDHLKAENGAPNREANIDAERQATADPFASDAENARKAAEFDTSKAKERSDLIAEAQPKEAAPEPEETPKERKASKVGQSIEAKTIERGLASSFSDTAEYDAITIKDQSERAAKLMGEDIERAKRIVLGKEALPEGLRAGTMLVAMENYAMENNDPYLLLSIANSPLASETSVHAQEMRLLAERDPDSAVANLQKLKKMKEEAAKKRGLEKKQVVAEIKKAVKAGENAKVKATRETWASFVDSITC